MIDGGLFTRDFLLEGIREAHHWRAIDDARVAKLRDDFLARLEGLAAGKNPNEAQTEEDVVYPVLEALGWAARDVQPNAAAKARTDVPDALLYADADAKAKAAPLDGWRRFQHGLCLVESKRWGRPLDREEKGRKGEEGTPSSQMLRYLRRADDLTKGALRWGILTNGRVWRLYFQGAVSVAEEFFEIDLGKVLGVAGCEPDLLDRAPPPFANDDAWRSHLFKLFVALFAREAFLPEHRGESFHLLARREGERWEAKVAKSLSAIVFDNVFPTLGRAIVAADPDRPDALTRAYLTEAREAERPQQRVNVVRAAVIFGIEAIRVERASRDRLALLAELHPLRHRTKQRVPRRPLRGEGLVQARDRLFARSLHNAIKDHVGELRRNFAIGRDIEAIRRHLSGRRHALRRLRSAVKGIRDAMDGAMNRSVSPQDAAAWQEARRQYGNYKAVERAVGGAGSNNAEGRISPQWLRAAIAQGGNKGAYVRGQGDYADLARAGNAIMSPLPNSGTAQRNFLAGATGGATLAGSPLTAAASLGVPAMAGRAIMSDPVQKYLSNHALTPFMRAVIERQIRAGMMGGAETQSPKLRPR